jgi:glycosyltransferase involved in cell wall biosynthesis
MRIVFISTYPPAECGIATYTQYLNRAVRQKENETFVISQVGGLGKNVIDIFWQESISLATQVYNASAKVTPDIVHVQHEFGLYGNQKSVQIIELLVKYRLVGIPVVTTLHTVFPTLHDDEKILLRLIVSESAAVIVHEQFQKDVLVKHFGSAEKIHVIPHGVRDVEVIADAKAKLEIEGKKAVLLCGYFRPTKGFHKIVEIFPAICKKVKDPVLVIAGKARGLEYLDYQKRFFEAINNSPENGRILVLRGQFPQKTFDTILSASDVVVLPYEAGAQSGIMAQCYAFGKPVVTSDLYAFQVSLSHSGGGLTCDNDEAFVDNIVKILNDDSLRGGLGDNIRRYVKNEVSWDIVADKTLAVYHKIVRVPYGKARHVYFE